MGRAFLIVMAVVGLFSAFLGRGPSASKSGDSFDHYAKSDTRPSDQAPSKPSKPSEPSEPSEPVEAGAVALERSGDGHFYADVEINGTPVHMLVDTGASGVALSREAARSAGIAISIGMNEVVGEGADGAVHGEQVRIDRMRLGAASAEGISAVVLNAGDMSLLGQDFLQRFQSVEIKDDRMILR